MRIHRWIVTLALAAAVMPAARAAERDPTRDARARATTGLKDPRTDVVKKAMTPGENHKRLDYFLGDWTTQGMTWLANGEAVKSAGTCHFEWTMGGRYLRSSYAGIFMDQPLEGLGVDGYDNVSGDYFYLWIDNMGTGYLAASGSVTHDGKTFTYTSTSQDALSRKPVHYRIVRYVQEPDAFVLQMYMTSPGGRESKVMQIRHARVAPPPQSALPSPPQSQ